MKNHEIRKQKSITTKNIANLMIDDVGGPEEYGVSHAHPIILESARCGRRRRAELTGGKS